jgi:hypothetical protein
LSAAVESFPPEKAIIQCADDLLLIASPVISTAEKTGSCMDLLQPVSNLARVLLFHEIELFVA